MPTRQECYSRAVCGGWLRFPVLSRESTEDRVTLSSVLGGEAVCVSPTEQGKRRRSSHIAVSSDVCGYCGSVSAIFAFTFTRPPLVQPLFVFIRTMAFNQHSKVHSPGDRQRTKP